MAEMYGLEHILYIVFSLLITIVSLILLKKYVKSEKVKLIILRTFSILILATHASIMWYDFLANGGVANIKDNVLFQYYFCNLMMYLLPFAVFRKNPNNNLLKFIAIGCIFGGIITILYPDFFQYDVFFSFGTWKSLLSHSFMIFAGFYAFTSGILKLRVNYTLVFAVGLLGCGLYGLIMNSIFSACGININSMYLKEPPIPDVPFLNFYTIAILLVLIVFVASWIYELCTVKKEERTFYKLKLKLEERKTNKAK